MSTFVTTYYGTVVSTYIKTLNGANVATNDETILTAIFATIYVTINSTNISSSRLKFNCVAQPAHDRESGQMPLRCGQCRSVRRSVPPLTMLTTTRLAARVATC